MVELLFWPALVAYGEAAVAFLGEARRPGLYGLLATWGVRVGWLVQTALLVAQALRAEGFAWTSWGGSLELFVWLVVGAYLIWGCRPRFRLLGLGVAPVAVALLVLARFGGGDAAARARYSTPFLVLHVGLVLAAFAGFTLAAALSALYLWHERRLKLRPETIVRRRTPPLALLDSLVGRTIAVSLPTLTLGIGVGLARWRAAHDGLDAVIALTLLAWLVYGAFCVLRFGAGWRGRRSAYVALAGFALVALVRLGFPVSHFS